MSYASIDDLRSQLGSKVAPSEALAYADKMLHPIPAAKTVDRAKFLVERCTGKRVLEFGASGPMHEAIKKVSSSYWGVDREAGDRVVAVDLDEIGDGDYPDEVGILSSAQFWQRWPDDRFELFQPEVVICGEVLEHLSNPGWFLKRLNRQFAGVPVVITVPNAFSAVARKHAERGTENVNRDHVAWYSPKTLSVLLERHGYGIAEFYFYGGQGATASGLIVVTE